MYGTTPGGFVYPTHIAINIWTLKSEKKFRMSEESKWAPEKLIKGRCPAGQKYQIY